MSRCPNCMSELTDRNCSICGYPMVEQASVKEALPVGTLLNNRYELGNALGKSYQSIAYIAYDAAQSQPVIILEFYPKSVVARNGNEVSVRGNREMFVEASRRYLTSDQVQPLFKLDSFAQNNTVYRVYRMNKSHSARAIEEAEALLDDPILFRNADGKPDMSVNALAIPQLPLVRQWTMSKRIQSEKKHLFVRNALVAVLVCAISILAGFFAFDAVRTHEVMIVVSTGSEITRATFGDIVLTDGTSDPEKNEVSFVVHVKKGEYALNVETEDGMQSDEQVCYVKKPARFAVVVPEPIPEVNVEPGQWLIDDNGNYYIFDENSGKSMNAVGRLAKDVSLVDISVEVDRNTFEKDKNWKVFIQRGNAKYDLPLSGDTAYAKVSAGEYALYLNDGIHEKQLTTLNSESGYNVKLNMDAIRCYLECLSNLDENETVFFIADECSLEGAEITREDLNAWAEEYPSLFGSFRQRLIRVLVSNELEEGEKEYRINGKKWQPGDEVSLSSNTDEWKLSVQIENDKISYMETISVSANSDAIMIGENIVKQIIRDEKWTETEKLIDEGDFYTLILQDGGCISGVYKTQFDEALNCFGARFSETLFTRVAFSYEFDERVHCDWISKVTLDGVELKKNATGGSVQIAVTPGSYELVVSFTNGLEPVIYPIEVRDNSNITLLYEQAQRASGLMESLKELGVYGAVQIGEQAYYLPVSANALSETDAETCFKYMQVYAKAFDENQWKLSPVEIYVDESIRKDKIQTISIDGVELLNIAYPCAISATAYDSYEVKITFTDGYEVVEKNLAVIENGTNQWQLLKKKAKEWTESLAFWGEDRNQLSVFEGMNEYLTAESIEKAMEGYRVYDLSVIGVEQHDWIKKYIIRSRAEGNHSELSAQVEYDSGIPMLCVFVPNGTYELWIVSSEDAEYLFIEEMVVENDTPAIINIVEEGYQYPDPADRPSVNSAEEATPEEAGLDTEECEHVPGDIIEEIPATCTGKGKITRKCVICGEMLIEETAKLEHQVGIYIVTVKPTCEKMGVKERSCDLCGEKKSMPVKALGHAFGEFAETTKPTCTQDGEKTRVCGNEGCNKKETEPVKALGHEFGAFAETTKATCTQNGEKTSTCTRNGCNEAKTEAIKALGHEFGDFVETTKATCTQNGEKTSTCTRSGCNEAKTEAVKALGHEFGAFVETTKATCTQNGEKTSTCTRSGCNETKTETVNALGHEFGAFIETTKATCTQNGEKTSTCTRIGCNETKTETIIAPGHTLDADGKCTCGYQQTPVVDPPVNDPADPAVADQNDPAADQTEENDMEDAPIADDEISG